MLISLEGLVGAFSQPRAGAKEGPHHGTHSHPSTIQPIDVGGCFFSRVSVDTPAPSHIVSTRNLASLIFKPTDLTLAVIFRYWMHSVDRVDTRMNLGILLPLVEPAPPTHWREHFDKNPTPLVSELLPRLFLGASKTAGSDKKKRTPGQTADAVVSTSAAHLENLPLEELKWEYNFFHSLFNHSQVDYRAFNRAVYKSAKFWAANVSVLRRAAKHPGPDKASLYLAALMTFSSMTNIVDQDGKELINVLMYNWLSAGLLDALEETITACLITPRGASEFSLHPQICSVH